MNGRSVDPVTERVVVSSFQSICEEMGHAMIRAANSGIFVEGRDFSCAIVGPDAELVSSANFDPSHLSAMALTVEYTLLYFGIDNIREGDAYLVNDPFRGGGHLPDITLILPVFTQERLFAFAVNRAHHIDIGGMAVAGFPGTASSIYQEGLRIPPVRWFTAGVENTDVIEMITLNQRFSADQLGDFRAQLASAYTAERRLKTLDERYGTETVLVCMELSKSHAETLVRETLRNLPDGTYVFDEFVEDDGRSSLPYRIHAEVTVAGDELTVDYSGTSPQASGPVNSSFSNTLAGTFNAVMQLMGPEVPFNHGCFRPVTVTVPRGCLLNPVPPAPCFGGVTEVCIRLIDVVLGALAPVVDDLTGAGCYGTCINFSGGGYDTERDQGFGFYFFVEGGWGACSWRDGWNCTPNPTSNFNDYPVEWTESELPLLYHEVRLNIDSGGPGYHRGGVGTVRRLEILADDVELNGLGERFIIPPYGLNGGSPGGLNGIVMLPPGENGWKTISQALGTVSPSKFHDLRAARGTQFQIITGGGGGYGNPLTRSPEHVVEDVRNGFVSREGARRDYGIEIVERKNGELGHDLQETAKLRKELSGLRSPALLEYERVLSDMHDRAVQIMDKPEVDAEIRRVNDLVRRAKSAVAFHDVGDVDAKRGRSLSNPFQNDLAMQFWDSHALERWAARHNFDLRESRPAPSLIAEIR